MFFTKAAFLTFGGAYAVLPYVAQAGVEQFGWLTGPQMMDGLGLAETTPGPLIMVLQFVGFMAGWNQPGVLSPFTGSILGSLVATYFTFLPCFLFIFLGAPYIEKFRGNRKLSTSLSSITAAVVGVVLIWRYGSGCRFCFRLQAGSTISPLRSASLRSSPFNGLKSKSSLPLQGLPALVCFIISSGKSMTKNSNNHLFYVGTANIDPEEIAKFAALAPIWWDRRGLFKALHDINGLRVGFINARAPLAGKKVLDLGCGGGILSEALATLGAAVTGIDAAEDPLAVAKLHMKNSGLEIDYRLATAERFAEEAGGRFDIVACMELLEHVPDPRSIVAACANLVKPGGDVFYATLNRNLKSFLFAIVGAEWVLRLVKRGTHSYRRFIRPSELQAWSQASGLSFQDLTGLHYNPFTRRYSLGGNTHVNYLMHLRKLS